MNKRFFTLMAAVMLAGSPFASEVFAQNAQIVATAEDNALTADFAPYVEDEGPVLANGVKFILRDGESYVKTTSVKVKNGTFNQLTDNVATAEEATVFEVRNYVSNALGVTFSLYADGKQFGFGGTTTANASTTFTATKGTNYQLGNLNAINVAQVGGATPVFNLANVEIGTLSVDYDEAAFNEYNKNNVTLSFDASGLEGNVFAGMVAVTFEDQADDAVFVDGTYLVKGKAADIKAFKEAQTKETAAKLTFVYLNNEQYKIDALVNGEGYKFTTINGAQFYAEKNAAIPNNAAFTGFNEPDQLNEEGALVVTISPINLGADKDENYENLLVAAVKTSASDTKSYVTTLNTDEDEGSRLTPIYPTLGANSYFAASEFVKQGEVSAYNIYFLSNNKSEISSATEYHKYLVALGETENHGNDLMALAANNVDLTTPYAQWVVTEFDGRYTITLENRMTGDELTLRLGATDNAGVYTVDKAEGSIIVNTPEDYGTVDLDETTIKLIPTTVGKYDGFKQLAKADREEGLKLSFSGKSAQLGTPTYYAELVDNGADAPDNLRYKLRPNTDEETAEALQFNAYEPTEEEAADFVNVIDYLCLNAAGQLTTAKDTLAYPVYTVSKTWKVGTENKTYYLSQDMRYNLPEENADKFVVVKSIDGTYRLATLGYTTVWNEETESNEQIDANVIITVSGTTFKQTPEICMPWASSFSAVAFTVNDNSDKTTLPAIARHATFENPLGAISMQENKNGILEGILSAAPMTFWLDTADSEKVTPYFYISKGIAAAEEETPETKADEAVAMRNFLVYAPDSMNIFDEGSALQTQNKAYILEGTLGDLKAFFRPAALIAEDTLKTVVDGKEVLAVAKDAKAGQINALNNFQFGICLADEAVADEYVIYSKADNGKYLYSHNGKLGFGTKKQALIVTLGEGDPTANEAIEAESNVQVIGGQGVVTVQGAAGKVVTVANILGQTIANQVAASDNVTIAAPAGIVVVAVDGEATKVVVK